MQPSEHRDPLTQLRQPRPHAPPSAEAGASEEGRGVEVATALTSKWSALDVCLRRQVENMFEGVPAANGIAFAVDGDLPAEVVRDLTCVGCAFRIAFPALVRRVVEISSCDALVTVRVTCEGIHAGIFFQLLRPTHRRVCFNVVHRLAFEDAVLRGDRVSLDVRRIISQLAAPTTPRPPLAAFPRK